MGAGRPVWGAVERKCLLGSVTALDGDNKQTAAVGKSLTLISATLSMCTTVTLTDQTSELVAKKQKSNLINNTVR